MILTGIQIPLVAEVSSHDVRTHPNQAHYRNLERIIKARHLKAQFSSFDAWVGKYQVGPDGVRKTLWKKQLGTSDVDVALNIATDQQGNVLISGATFGDLASKAEGYGDAWVAKYSSNGTLLWKRQLGSYAFDVSNGIAVDKSGNVWITGETVGELGGANQGDADGWIAKYNATGKLMWKHQIGTSAFDSSAGIAVDNQGNAVISGYTEGALAGSLKGRVDAWVAKYSSYGVLRWQRQLGTTALDTSYAVATDPSDNVLITGTTYGQLGGKLRGRNDAFVAKFNPFGQLQWTRQLGTSRNDLPLGVAADAKGDVLISGSTSGSLGGENQGQDDGWIAKLGSHGALRWTRQLGSTEKDVAMCVATDQDGNVFTAGNTSGVLRGSNRGMDDAWMAKVSSSGKTLWTQQEGTLGIDVAAGVATDNQGYVLVAGYTQGNLARP